MQVDLDEAVARGVHFLDRKAPGWRDRIDWDRLDMSTAETDILALVFGDRWRSIRGQMPGNAVVLGFDLPPGITTPAGFDRMYAHLTVVWKGLRPSTTPPTSGGPSPGASAT